MYNNTIMKENLRGGGLKREKEGEITVHTRLLIINFAIAFFNRKFGLIKHCSD
jgi:hypothetical protein